ncbi:MAG: hypothetical protein PWR19_1924 [Carnobacterium sp.]|uniref:general stress protein n=1 Tax=Carnobacterium TaxID=2747 RepID=UPI00203D7BC6|nr:MULTISPECIES: general stress protein [Carnobacterium]MCM3513526.1 general stress protein [Carnobacterium inhibens]MDN5372878.1 hypothetical protein [Carnobacterium sp.]
MEKRVIGSYPSKTTALQKLNELLIQGYSKELITLVTNPDTERSIHSQTDVEVIALSSEPKNDESLGDKMKDFFSLSPQADTTLDSAVTDEELLVNYKESIKKGSIIILLEDDSNETTYPVNVDAVGEDAAGIYPNDPDLQLEDDPSDLARGEKQPPSMRTQHLNYNEDDLDPGINTDGDLEIEEDFPPTETPDRSDFSH